MQNDKPDEGTLTAVCTAAYCHFQDTVSTIIESFADGSVKFPVHFYSPDKDWSNNFVVVKNRNTGYIKARLDFESILKLFSYSKQTEGGLSRGQVSHFDGGYTTSMCMTRVDSPNGIARPRLRPGSTYSSALSCISFFLGLTIKQLVMIIVTLIAIPNLQKK